MDSLSDSTLAKAQAGDAEARNSLIESHRSFILKSATGFCKRKLTWENDEELSVAMLAFSEAVDSYNASYGTPFLGYANLVIKRRLTDHARKEGRNRAVLLGDVEPESLMRVEGVQGGDADLERLMWREEFQSFERLLAKFGMELRDLVANSPKHKKVRNKVAAIAAQMCSDPELLEKIFRTSKLPVQEICLRFSVSRKFVETWRRYLLAMLLIASRPEFSLMKNFIISLFDEGEGEKN